PLPQILSSPVRSERSTSRSLTPTSGSVVMIVASMADAAYRVGVAPGEGRARRTGHGAAAADRAAADSGRGAGGAGAGGAGGRRVRRPGGAGQGAAGRGGRGALRRGGAGGRAALRGRGGAP